MRNAPGTVIFNRLIWSGDDLSLYHIKNIVWSWDRLLGTSSSDRPDDRFWAVSHGWCPVVKAYSFICIQYLLTIQHVYLIQDTFITFSRPCEAARQIGAMYCIYGWCKIMFFVNLHSFTLIPKLITKFRYINRRAKFRKSIFGSNGKTYFINCTSRGIGKDRLSLNRYRKKYGPLNRWNS